MKTAMKVRDLMAVPGFVVCSKLLGVFGDRYARVIVLRRRKKQPSAPDRRTCRIRDLSIGVWRIWLEFERWRVYCPRCRAVYVERLDWLAENPRYTNRFAMRVGSLCREMTNKAVAELEWLHHGTVKDLDKIYMAKQVALAGLPAPRVIGVDEVAIRKGHDYRIVVSDLDLGRPIWVGGRGRKEEDLDLFFEALGPKKTARIRLAAMDMWKPFYDKFHIMRHLGEALDAVRRSEYKRLAEKDRSFIKGQRYTLLSNRENLDLDGRRALAKLFKANARLNRAYLLKESFGQLWDYKSELWARRFFESWRESLKWQRLKPNVKFAAMIERHWEGIASYCHPENKCSLGMVEGLNNKIRVLQRRAYGYCDEEYLKLKIIAAFLPPLGRSVTK
jgi:transposase